MLRDFTIVSTAMGASFVVMKRAGFAGILSLFLGVVLTFSVGVALAYMYGYMDAKSLTIIGAGGVYFYRRTCNGNSTWSKFGSHCVEHCRRCRQSHFGSDWNTFGR